MLEKSNELFAQWVAENYPQMVCESDFNELDFYDMKSFGHWLLLKSAEAAKQIRHQAAEIAISVGIERSGEMAHQDIMNLNFDMK